MLFVIGGNEDTVGMIGGIICIVAVVILIAPIFPTERGIQVHLFVRKNKDDKISKEFYYLGHMQASGKVKEFIMPNTDKTAVEIEWLPADVTLIEKIKNNMYI